MKDRTAARLAWVAFGLIALSFVGGLGFSVLNATGPQGSGWDPAAAVTGLAMLSFPIVGVLVASRHPRNAVGWILLAIGFVWEFAIGMSEGYIRYAYVTDPGSLPRPDVVAALYSSMWVPGVGLIGTFLILLFPNGRLPSPRWKPLAWLSAVVLIVLTVAMPVTPGSIREVAQLSHLPETPNPLGIDALRPVKGSVYVILPLLPLCILGSAAGLIARFRRSHGRERLQLKWLASGAALTAVLYLTAITFSVAYGSDWSGNDTALWLTVLQNVSILSFVLIPVAAGIAILKYRLYDIDLIINRALVYGGLTAALVAVYVAGVLGMGAAARAITGQESNDVAVAASTLAVASLFGPLRRGLQGFIDRRFYRSKYDAEQTLAEFAATLRDKVDLGSLNAELVGVVSSTVQPSHVSVWLRSPAAPP
jgi:hypothetical protein